jgi:hypothetical protein
MRLRALVVGGLLAWSGQARALDQGEWQLSAGPAFALLVQGGQPTSGLGGRVEGRYALRDDSAAWAAVGASWHPRAAETVRASYASAGFALAFDVFRVVPFVEVGATVTDEHGRLGGKRYLGAELAAGGEYLLDRHWSAALVARYHYLPVPLDGGPTNTGLLTVGLRVGRTF